MVQRIAMAPQGPEFSRFVMGYWRLMDWKMSPGELVSFIEQHLDLGVTTVDHADIYGDYQCEAAFGEALKRAPHLRSRMEIVSKCGIVAALDLYGARMHDSTVSHALHLFGFRCGINVAGQAAAAHAACERKTNHRYSQNT